MIYTQKVQFYTYVLATTANLPESASYPDASLLMKMCPQRKAGRRQLARRRFACRLYPSHGPLRFITSHSFRARLCHAKNEEAPEEEAVPELRRRRRLDGWTTKLDDVLTTLRMPRRFARENFTSGRRRRSLRSLITQARI